jgi:penicillin-binding protein 1A
LDEIPAAVVRAVIDAEDGRFREHHGVDWVALGEELEYAGEPPFSWFDPGDLKALWGAVRYGWTHRTDVRGRSTITQQLAKNLYFTPDRSLGRKAAETVVAWRLEWFLSKDRILEMYLNSVELGSGIFGVEAAAQAYFGTSVRRLGAWEAASLAATLPHPLTSNPAHRPGRMAWRRDLIFRRLTGSSGSASPIPPAPPDLEPPPLPMNP